jgi:hypothetical protein
MPFASSASIMGGGNYGLVPAATSLTQRNFTGGSIANYGNTLYLSHAGTAATDLTAVMSTAPAAPWTFTCLFVNCMTTSIAAYQECGICFGDGTKFATFGWQWDYTANRERLLIRRYTNATTTSTTYVDATGPAASRLCWMRIADDNSNRICSWSLDGENFVTLHTVTRTDHLTASEFGLYVDPNRGGGATGATVACSVSSWLVT